MNKSLESISLRKRGNSTSRGFIPAHNTTPNTCKSCAYLDGSQYDGEDDILGECTKRGFEIDTRNLLNEALCCWYTDKEKPKQNYHDFLVDAIKSAAHDLIDNAESYANNATHMQDLDIHIHLPQPSDSINNNWPYIKIEQRYVSDQLTECYRNNNGFFEETDD